MFFLRNRQSILLIIGKILFTVILIPFIIFGISFPVGYIFLFIDIVFLLFLSYKSDWIRLNDTSLTFRKLFLYKKIDYSKINYIFITKYRCSNIHDLDYHKKKTKQVSAYVYLLKSIDENSIFKNTDSSKHTDALEEIYMDFEYRNKILTKILNGGFNGKLYLTKEMNCVVGRELKNIWINARLDVENYIVENN